MKPRGLWSASHRRRDSVDADGGPAGRGHADSEEGEGGSIRRGAWLDAPSRRVGGHPADSRLTACMPPRDLNGTRRLELRARELRRGKTVDPDTAQFNERVADGLRVTGDVIRWMRTGERPGG